jgi:hypothetical protein
MIEYRIRQSMKICSKYWCVEKLNIISKDERKTVFTVHNKKWFKTKTEASKYCFKMNRKCLK